ncbi:farnesol dehydrogenase [Scaptodrosophila lebanonensis]|uniref:Farnesol dehydrogenase n=1 Tax=Drosophila lebanonensis TaxID=7225 RepID=A0A6J2TPM3_DROLE|nr:farnesol dehydrogenase [Scaptodrosophila lebanonensis]
MERWLNRVAVVTGASSGIGAACCRDLVAKGMVVVGLARRKERLDELKAGLPADQRQRFHGYKCDVSVEDEVVKAFAWVDKDLGGADVLVNNAGIVRHTQITDAGNGADLRAILDTNVLGVSWCTREAFNSLQRRKVDDGHVVIVNSVAGHKVPVVPNFSFSMYAPSKHAVTALTEVLRQEFLNKGTKTKITSISPGAVDTEIIDKSITEKVGQMPMLRSEDISDAVVYCIQTPPNVQIHDLIIKPVGEFF